MAKKVFKYQIPTKDIVKITVPAGSRPLRVGYQHYHLCVWVEVDDKSEADTELILRIAGTGHSLSITWEGVTYPYENMIYLNTCEDVEYGFVWHAYWYCDPARTTASAISW